jgi:hypothetical protein
MTIHSNFNIGDKVYFALGGEDSIGIVTGILVRENNYVEYEVTWKDRGFGWYKDVELSDSDMTSVYL